jgi:NAD(P)-dependent dehydrogenase (short-subunit alcohol dehydrogenase family)
MIGDVRGRCVLVIGGTRGIGFAIAERLGAEGARVGLTGRSEGAARKAAAKVANGTAYALDVTDRPSIGRAVERFASDHGAADALIYSAGISPAFTSAEKLDVAAWDDIVAVNQTGAFIAAQAFARIAIAHARPASIVFVGSVAGISGAGRLAAYSATKAALVGLAKSLAWDWARHRIRVNVIAPGYVETDMTEGVRGSESLARMILSRTPQGRMAAPGEIADLVVFLASDSASYATGSVFTLDGGWTSG